MKYRGIRGNRVQIIRDLKDINDEIMEERDPSILKSASQKSARQQRYYTYSSPKLCIMSILAQDKISFEQLFIKRALIDDVTSQYNDFSRTNSS
jgi:hypothetical protein